MNTYAPPREDVWGPRRARIIAAALALVFVVIVGRSAWVVFNGPERSDSVSATAEKVRRADIVDRDGQLLVTTVQGWSLAADPSAIWDPEEVAASLKTVFPGIDTAQMAQTLSDKKRRFVWIQRSISERERRAVKSLGVEALRFVEEPQRVYPNGALAGHLLGYTNVDGVGVEGIENIYNDRLSAGGQPLRLTLDASVQYVLEEELQRSLEQFEMKGAAGMVIDAHTGAVRAIASWPLSDPRKRGDEPDDAKTNRAINARMELGSIYKPLTVAAALEAGELTPADEFNVSGPVKIGAVLVRDPHPLPHAHAVTAGDIIAHSSNIGASLIAQRIGPQRLQSFLGELGLLGGFTTQGPQTASPLAPTDWDETSMATIAYGHGISVSPLAFAMTYTPFATGGELVSPVFLEPVSPSASQHRQVMSKQTADTVLGMLRRTVTEGSGKLADAPGYEVAGKTGTAEKPTANGYDPNRNITSFAAVFPASRPQFVVLVVLDEAQPRTGAQRTAAYTAAMIAGKVIARSAPLLDVQPVLVSTNAEAASLRDSEGTTP
ncbi:MAG: penicillin-binding protein 2 [Hyphomonadaceae bacterium]